MVETWYREIPEIEWLLGKTIVSIESENPPYDYLTFKTTSGDRLMMYHDQECCESVTIEDIVGDLNDLIGSPITQAEEVVEDEEREGLMFQYTWTFYKLATIKGYVTIRWCGNSNGYYSESVNFKFV